MTDLLQPTIDMGAAEGGATEYLPGLLMLQEWDLPLVDPDTLVSVRVEVQGCNAFRLRCRPNGAFTVVEVFRILVDPITRQQISDPTSGTFYDNIAVFGAAGVLFQFGANGASFTLYTGGAMMGLFDLVFITGVGGYNGSAFLECYHQQGLAS